MRRSLSGLERPARRLRGWAARWLLAGVLLGGPACAATLPSFDEVRAAYRSSDSLLLDRHGATLQLLRTDDRALRGAWVSLADTSPALRSALLLSEDKRFYEHSGVDWSAVSAAAWGQLWHGRTRGASTLTMQLAGLLDAQLALPGQGRANRSLLTKLDQAATALSLERRWRKDQILEAYLNLVSFRGERVGIAALSASLFHKLPSGLDAEEAAIAAALLRSPNAAAEQVGSRACRVLTEQGQAALCAGLGLYTARMLEAPGSGIRLVPDEQLAPHLARRLLAGSGGAAPASITSTLDAGLQRYARDSLRRQLSELGERHVEDGALIAIDNASGDVLAWVGSSGELSAAADVDGVSALRQAGSTLKPFLYEFAIEQRWLTAASLIDDSALGLPAGGGLYMPENYDHGYKGLVSLRSALGASLNVPAVRTLNLVTPARYASRLTALGLPLRHDGDHYGLSLALGSAEVTLATLANAYRSLANGGRSAPLRLQAADPRPPPVRVMDEAASYIVGDILADREARVLTFGLDNALAARYWAAVKTGTSKDMRDNWCVGYTRRYTVAVWVGNASGAPMWDVSGVSGAAPVWRAVMDQLQRRHPDPHAAEPPAAPAALVRQRVRYEPALEPPRLEWFLAGTGQPVVRLASAAGAAQGWIRAPAPGTIFALDPDIPGPAQTLHFVPVTGVSARWVWRLDGRQLGPAIDTAWAMWPGAHRIELVDEAGRLREGLQFEVRGAQLKPGRAVARPPVPAQISLTPSPTTPASRSNP